MYTRAMGIWGARTAKAQWLMKVKPPAMVDTAIAQQYQIDDSEHDLNYADIKEVGWREHLACLEMHIVVVVDVWWRRFEVSVSSVCCWIGGKGPFPWDSGMQKASG